MSWWVWGIWVCSPAFLCLIWFLKYSLSWLTTMAQRQRQERLVTKELPVLIDFLRSYLMAGLLLPQALSHSLRVKKWCHPICQSLQEIQKSYAYGERFQKSVGHQTGFSGARPSRRFLHQLYLSLTNCPHSGDQVLVVLEKIKHKAQESLSLEKKLRTATAQIRLQSSIIFCAPLALAGILYLISSNSILFFFTEPIGHVLLFMMVILNLAGGLVLRRLTRFFEE